MTERSADSHRDARERARASSGSDRRGGAGAAGVPAELKTFGPRAQATRRPLSTIGGKGLFTKELGDGAVEGHGRMLRALAQDLPTESPGLTIAAVLVREDPRASWCSTTSSRQRDSTTSRWLADWHLEPSSPAQVLALRPDLDVVELRGNVPTRLRKVDEGQVHAAILAAAGLHRLDARSGSPRISSRPGGCRQRGRGLSPCRSGRTMTECGD